MAVIMVNAIALIIIIPPVAAQTNPPSAAQGAELAETKALNQQVIQLYTQGKYTEAIPLAQCLLAIREQVLGQNHPDVTEANNHLGLLYSTQGKYSQAEPLYQRAIAISEQALGQKHPVDDFATRDLITSYYGRLQKNVEVRLCDKFS